MITSIRLKNFKNFADETLRVGPFTILVGANASGKSNIRDAFRFLSGIGRGYTLAEIFGGKREAGWKPIRGAMNEIVRFGQSSFSIEVGLKLNGEELRYSITVRCGIMGSQGFQVTHEEIKAESTTMYTAGQDSLGVLWVKKVKGHPEKQEFRLDSAQPALTQYFPLDNKGEHLFNNQIFADLRSVFANMRFLELSPDRMREPAFPGATVLGDSGENLPVVLQEICADPKRREILISWIAELTPMDVTGFEFPIDPSGRVHLSLCEKNGIQVSASSASDGTLRFLALLAVLLGDNPNGLYFFDEIDTGIHPVRLSLLMDLIERQTAKRSIQVIATTHAPTLLTVMNDDTFENSSVVCRLEDNTDAIIRPLAKLPNVRELRQDQGLARLHESGWMEDMLFFSEENEEEADGE